MKRQSKKAPGRKAAGGKMTLPEPPLLTRFQLSRKIARELQKAAATLGLPPEWCIEDALGSFCGSLESDFIGGCREGYIQSVADGDTFGVTPLDERGPR